jgi:hypothetical protein
MSHPKQGDLAAYLAKQTKADAKNADDENTEFSTIASPLGGDDFEDVADISDEELEQQALDHGGADDNPHTPE